MDVQRVFPETSDASQPSARRPTLRHDFPSPLNSEGSVQEVQQFFREYFLAINETLEVQEAQAKAQKLAVNGAGLYLMHRPWHTEAEIQYLSL